MGMYEEGKTALKKRERRGRIAAVKRMNLGLAEELAKNIV